VRKRGVAREEEAASDAELAPRPSCPMAAPSARGRASLQSMETCVGHREENHHGKKNQREGEKNQAHGDGTVPGSGTE
jgi:hypothetical protein